jgi:hypothetical protein
MTLRTKYIPYPENIRVIFLNRPDTSTLVSFIQDRFRATGKKIDQNAAGEIVSITGRIPFYCQLLASRCWCNIARTSTIKVVRSEAEQLVLENSLSFSTITGTLTHMQIKFLRAVSQDGYQPYSRDFIRLFDMRSTAHVARIQKSLIKKEIIIYKDSETLFLNPFYRLWLSKHCYR